MGNWLCSRHPELAQLVTEIGCMLPGDKPDMNLLRDCVISFDKFKTDRVEYGRKNSLKGQAVSITMGPQPTRATSRMLLMAPSEIARLRLLATCAPGVGIVPGVEWCVDDLAPFDAAGHKLVADWITAISGYVYDGD
jgi:hypothetical protein